VLRVPPEFLPDVARAVMPRWLAEDEDSRECPEVSGIPGLRARHEKGHAVLYRLGFPGRVAVPATPGLWRKAVAVAHGTLSAEGNVRSAWLLAPGGWHPAEAGFTAAWPDAFSPSGSRYPASGFASRVLRRLPGLCALPRAGWHDLWVNHWGTSPEIQFEWLDGPACATPLGLLLDPEFGPGAELEPFDGQSECDCYSAVAGRVRVRAAGEPGGRLVLRRLSSHGHAGDETGFGAWRHDIRDAVERKHGYRAHRSQDEPAASR
jgi:hypothetical protein